MSQKPSVHSQSSQTYLLATRLGGIAGLLILFVLLVKASPISQAAKQEPVLPQETLAAQESPAVDTSSTAATIAFTGDIMAHTAVYESAYDSATDTYDFTPFFDYAGTWLQDADLTVGNLETTFGSSISGYPSFSSPDELASNLVTLGFDLVSTANNHCMDSGTDGLLRTLEILDEAGLDHVGTYASQEAFDANKGIVVEEVNGISIAFLDYTYGTNYIDVPDDWMVNRYNLNTDAEDEIVSELDTEKLDAELEYARSLDTDLIFVMIHWGTELETTESTTQDEIADYLIARGADAVLGGHSHVPQPMEYRTVTGIDGNEATGFVVYSLGNLISNMTAANTCDTAIVNIQITKENGVTSITSVSYEPMYLIDPGNSGLSTLVLLDIPAAMADYNGSKSNPYVTDSIYTTIQSSQENIKSILGSEWPISYDLASTSDTAASTEDPSDSTATAESETVDTSEPVAITVTTH